MSRIAELAAALYEGDLSPESREELRQLLAEDTQAVDDFVLECLLLDELSGRLGDEQLREQIAAAVDVEPANDHGTDSQPVIPRPALLDRASRHPVAVGVAVAFVVTASVVLTLAFTPLSSLVTRSTKDKDNDQPTRAPQEIATLTAWHRPDWVKQHAISPRNHRITAGQRIALKSGVIEITYDTGAKVVIEGPAEFTAGDSAESRGQPPADYANSGFLELGSLVARCDTPDSHGFKIETATGSIKDLSTEFAVHVDQLGKVQVHVFEGRVRVGGTMGTLAALDQMLTAGEGLAWNATGRVQPSIAPVGRRYAVVTSEIQRGNGAHIVSDLEPGLLLTRFDAHTPRLIYPGNETKIVDAPAALVGLAAIVPPRGAGMTQPGAGYRFHVSERARLYLLVHNRGDHAPVDWERTEDQVTWTIAGQNYTDTVYTRVVEAGEITVPPHEWRDEDSGFGVPHTCLVAPLSDAATDTPAKTKETSTQPEKGDTQ